MSLLYVSLTRPPRHPDRGHSPAVTELLIELPETRPVLLLCYEEKTQNLPWKTQENNKKKTDKQKVKKSPKQTWNVP